MIIDAHTHIGTGTKPVLCSKEILLASMKEASIDHSIVIAGDLEQFSYMGELGTDTLVEYLNGDSMLSVVGSVDFDHLDTSDIFDNLFHHLERQTIVGVKVYPGYANFDPTDSRLDSLYDRCQQQGVPVIIHTGALVSWANGLLKQTHPLHLDEVAHRFPQLKLIMAHFGNPWVVDAAAVVAKNDNVFVDLSGYFSEYQPIDSQEAQAFVADLKYIASFSGGFDKCLFGTDWPLYSQKEYVEVVEQLPLSDDERELVLWKNANNLFHLGLEAYE